MFIFEVINEMFDLLGTLALYIGLVFCGYKVIRHFDIVEEDEEENEEEL